MFPIESFRNTLLKIESILRQNEIPFHLTGGITSAVYSEPRFTQDIDIVVSNEACHQQLDAFLDALKQSDFMFDPKAISQTIETRKMFQLFDSTEALKLDMYPREMIPGELNRSSRVEIFEGVILPIVARVDAAASKLVWISKGSHKSRRDFRLLMRTVNEAEEATIRQFAKDHQLVNLMDEVLAESDEIVD